MMPQAVDQGLAQRLAAGGGTEGCRGRAAQRLGQAPEALRVLRAARVDPLRGPCRQGADATIERVGVGNAAPQKESAMPGGIGPRVYVSAGKQRLYLRGHAQGLTVIGDIERLDTQRVACEQHAAAAFVPQREGIHSAQALDAGNTLAIVEVKDHFGVGFGAEDLALLLQLLAQGAVVIYLAVEDDAQPAAGGFHRLIGDRAQIDDRQAPMPHCHSAVG
jgi:hypothetical protein